MRTVSLLLTEFDASLSKAHALVARQGQREHAFIFMAIPNTKPDLLSEEVKNIIESIKGGAISGDGPFTERCHKLLSDLYGSPVLLMHSCTAALEAAAILADLGPGDEVIMPSFTFVSTANAVVLRGAIPVFLDVRPDTLNIDAALIEGAITPRTKAIIPVHYAGVGAQMDEINAIAARHNLIVIEDAAQGYRASLDGKPLGGIGAMGCLSFHVTKNIVSGEGGALIINDPQLVQRAHIIREKGTNRTQFLRKEVSKYEWLDVGSSFLPSDILAAVLLAQLDRADDITDRRLSVWNRYYKALEPFQRTGAIRLPFIPSNAKHNAHIFYVVARDHAQQQGMMAALREKGIIAVSHYVPLHSAPAGLKYGRTGSTMDVTNRVASTIVRLPLFPQMTESEVQEVINQTVTAIATVA